MPSPPIVYAPGHGPAIPLIHAELLRPALTFLSSLGTPVDRLLTRAGLPVRSAQTPQAALPLHDVYRFASECSRIEGIDDFGVQVGARFGIDGVGPVATYLSAAETLGEYLRKAAGIVQHFNTGFHWWLSSAGDSVTLHSDCAPSEDAGRAHVDAYGLIVILRMLRAALDQHWRPQRLVLAESTKRMKKSIEGFFQTDAIVSQRHSSFTFAASELDRPLWLPWAQHRSVGDVQQTYDRLPVDLVSGLRALLVSRLSQRCPDIDEAAAAANLSVRTLQRRLAAAGLTYRDLIMQTKHDHARQLLLGTDRSITEIAAEVGYEHPGNFTRAFLQVAGVTPLELRRAAQAGPATRS